MWRLAFVLAACLVLFMSACSAHQQTPTGENYYSEGQVAFATHDYKGATIYFQKLIDQYPFSPYAEEAELKIGLSEFQMKHYAAAITSLGDFEKMHPTSKQIELASYYLAMSHFNQIGRPDQDQTNTEQALQEFEIIERRYSETGFAALAQQQIAVCREMLARHQLLIGDFYYERANYRAAESRLAELMKKWPDTPVGDEALYQLGTTLENEGKKYSAAQAYTAVVLHYPNTVYAAKSKYRLKKLHQPVDTEEDPLRLVLAESGFGESDEVAVRQGDDTKLASAADSGAYPPLPLLKAPPAGAAPSEAGASGSTVPAAGAPAADPLASASSQSQSANASQSTAASAAPKAAAGAVKGAAASGPATLNRVRLSSSDPPMSVIFDLSGTVLFDSQLQNSANFSTLTIHLKETKPTARLASHLVFDRSIFRDCDIQADASGTTVTVNTTPVSRFAVVPLIAPARLLVTFTPQEQEHESSGADQPVDQAAN